METIEVRKSDINKGRNFSIHNSLPRLTKLQSLNVFINSTKDDPFGLVRMANILHNNSPPHPIVLRLKNITGDELGEVCIKFEGNSFFFVDVANNPINLL